MKLITAVIQPHKLEEVKAALQSAGVRIDGEAGVGYLLRRER